MISIRLFSLDTQQLCRSLRQETSESLASSSLFLIETSVVDISFTYDRSFSMYLYSLESLEALATDFTVTIAALYRTDVEQVQSRPYMRSISPHVH